MTAPTCECRDVEVGELEKLRGAPVYDRDNNGVGAIEEFFADETTRRPEFVGIATGSRRVLVPAHGAQLRDGSLHVPYDKEVVTNAPAVTGEDIDRDEACALYDHYSGFDAGGETAVIRREEQLRVGKQDVTAGKVRLRKWVETEDVATDVELEREHARVRREDIDRPACTDQIGEQEVEVSLREQEPVVEKDVVAKERVQVDKDVERQRETVGDRIRKERVEVDEDTDYRS